MVEIWIVIRVKGGKMDSNQTHSQERCEELPMLFDNCVLPMDPWDTFSKNHWLCLFHGRFSVWLQDMLGFFCSRNEVTKQ